MISRDVVYLEVCFAKYLFNYYAYNKKKKKAIL